jgi:hypothetical protein
MHGVDNKPVVVIGQNELFAVCSEVTATAHAPDINMLKKYGMVIEALYKKDTIIPMRYGCLLDNIEQIHLHLTENKQHYSSLLEELEGCVEMGIRFILAEATDLAKDASSYSKPAEPLTGRDYLMSKRKAYEQQNRMSEANRDLINRCNSSLAGYYKKCRNDTPDTEGLSLINSPHLLSLYFLTPMSLLEGFIDAFSAFSEKESVRSLLSGPWPPYNFAT